MATDELELLHFEAGLGLLRADTSLRIYPDVNLDVPDELVLPYVLVYFAVDILNMGGSTRMDGRSVTWDSRYYCHCVADTHAGALAIAARVRTQLLDKRPTVAGRVCHRIRKEANQQVTPDRSTPNPVYDWTDVYTMRSTPAGVIPLVDV